jgi:hypothetical protein
MIERRAVLAGAAAMPLATVAAGHARRPPLGVLLTGNESAGAGYQWSAPLRRALAGLGWIRGRRIGMLVNLLGQTYRDFPASLSPLMSARARDMMRVEAHDVATIEIVGAALQTWRADGLLVNSVPAFDQPRIDRALAALGEKAIVAKVLDLRTAKAPGIEIPGSLVACADMVLE